MRKGYTPVLVLDDKGEIFAISTGSDACSEHECGSRPLMAALCEGTKLRSFYGEASDAEETALLKALRAGKPVRYPALLERKRIKSFLSELVFQTGQDKKGTNCAVLGFAVRGMRAVRLDDEELQPWKGQVVTGAWDESGFAFRVEGDELVAKLQRFHAALLAKKGLFAGTFLKYSGTERLSGVIIALEDGLTPQHHEAILTAQQDWEATVRLKAKSRLDELYAKFRSRDKNDTHIELPGHLWPVWAKEVDGEVAYALNPGYGVNARYWGPYTLETLERWIFAKEKFELIPITK